MDSPLVIKIASFRKKMVRVKPGCRPFPPAHCCHSSGYQGTQAVIFTSAFTSTTYFTLESAIYILIKEVTRGI